MGLDFDVIEFCKKLRLERPPPYKCPVENCDKSYKSICGMQYHLVNYDHDKPAPQTPVMTLKKKGRTSRPATKTSDLTKSPPKEVLSYAESQRYVQFEIDGNIAKIALDDPIISIEKDSDLLKGKCNVVENPEPVFSLPEPTYRLVTDYNICDAPPRPNAYIRFIEKSTEELDGEVEYDVDEEDTAWLSLINEKRAAKGQNSVSVDALELLMDRLEKESYFQAAATGQNTIPVDDDAVCCICMDGECQNTNVILFCDMCNLAVHQDCYGVPYIPEGQWLCRRCLQSPSRPVNCVLCPNTGGAFKQTDRGHWAHVVCALWIPEVRFANTVFLEPIDSIESIPAARWKLSCYVCKQRGVGACIQCNRNNCYAAFHVTCAQHAGLYMRMDQVNREGDSMPVLVQKTAFCDAHAPPGAVNEVVDRSQKSREESRNKMKQARRLLAKKRTTVPVILIPTIPPERVQEIASLVTIQKKPQFIQRLIAYWTLKRHHRNGVPLLRRLQSQGSGNMRNMGDEAPDTAELCRQLKYWQCLRQDLERARLLCELVRKREKLKSALTRVKERSLLIEIDPLNASMGILLQQLEAKDTSSIFCEPVDPTEVPDYSTVVTCPMDLSTMRMKLENGQYQNLDDLEADFNLMIANCFAYNNKDTVFYKAGVKMRDQCIPILKNARKELADLGLLSASNSTPNIEETGAKEIDAEFQKIVNSSKNDKISELKNLLEKAGQLRHGLARAKRVKSIRAELKILKKNAVTDSSQSDGDEAVLAKSKTSPVKDTRNSPTGGVNRRTAVLFTKKAQAALRKPIEMDSMLAIEDNINKGKEDVQFQNQTQKQSNLSMDTSAPEVSSGRKNKKTRRKDLSKSANSTLESSTNSNAVSQSFLVYRARKEAEVSDSESQESLSESTCSSCSHESDDSCGNCSHSSEWFSSNDEGVENEPIAGSSKPSLKPLQLVWAKCRGYPWYPALIMDPETPRGFVHKGVPLPYPPSDVLTLRAKKIPADGESVFLVLFFDAKRTWQWLPASKLELLGISKSLDQQKLTESRKPADKKAVKKAYNDAQLYLSQVTDAQGPDAIM
ncbi:peregrin-like isoform X2 [Ctenocephalides felis]|uniref:peregrin-like isoform X2 n=1 Tax=Ctenocephalides felis TaxID=7515 RepID=UPI000E6E1958|nr:peregrin-like isoform X2 [Ctenocephalides felis]